MSEGTHLTGLEGTNPLGFLAALGVQVLFESEEHQPKLWWTDDIIPHTVVDPEFDLDRIVDQAFRVFPRWLESPALNPGFGTKVDDTAKFNSEELKTYLSNSQPKRLGSRLATALVAEGSFDNNKRSKPSDLYLSAGKAQFLKDGRTILTDVTKKNLANGLVGPWSYESRLPSLRWDNTDDPNWALSPSKPGVKKLTCPGPEALALLGLSLVPVFGSPGRTLTLGCTGSWNRAVFAWPLWRSPSSPAVVRSLLAHVTPSEPFWTERRMWYKAWSVSCIVQSTIRRKNTAGGIGNMGPVRITDINMNG